MDSPEADQVPGSNRVAGRLPRSQRKRLKREQKLERKRLRRPEEKRRRKAALREEREQLFSTMDPEEREAYIEHLRKTNYEKSLQLSNFLDDCFEDGFPICINCSFDDAMNAKEIRSLAKQIALCYNIIKKRMVPVKLMLTSLSPQSALYKDCEIFGIHKWKVHIEDRSFWDLFERENVVVLSPDATEEVSRDKVYVIGGLVDTNVKKFEVFNQAQSRGIQCKCLPIKEYIPNCKKKVLNVSTVFEILAHRINNLSWEEALTRCLPARSLS